MLTLVEYNYIEKTNYFKLQYLTLQEKLPEFPEI